MELGFEVQNPFGGYDLYETRGLGPFASPMRFSVRGEVETDTRRDWMVEPEVQATFEEGGGRGYATGLRGEWNVGTRLSLSGNLEVEWEDGVVAWSSNETFQRTAGGWAVGVEAAPPGALGEDDYAAFDDLGLLDAVLAGVTPYDAEGRYFVPVFVRRARHARGGVDLTLRSSVTFTPALSLQFYGQLFAARGRYGQFQILRDRDTPVPFDAFPKRDDFSFSSFTANMVLRWEYRPGSTFYVVWTHGRAADDRLNPLAPWGPSPYDVRLNEQVADVWGTFPSNVFLIKLSYTLLR